MLFTNPSFNLIFAAILLLLILFITYYSNISDRLKILICFFIFADLLVQFLSIREKFSLYSSVPFLVSVYLLYLLIRTGRKSHKLEDTFISFFSQNFKYNVQSYLKIIGSVLILTVFLMELIFFDRHLSGKGILVIVTGGIWFFYDRVPNIYSREKDFFLLFFTFLSLFFVFPSVVLKLSNQYFVSSSPLYDLDIIVQRFLTIPTSNLLNIIGFNVWVTDYNTLYYEDLSIGQTSSVQIAQECSGIFSMAIFISAFMAFVISEYKKFNIRMLLILLLGISISYISNLFRVVIVIIAGHYWGGEALYWVHINIGTVIFFIWFSLFWYIIATIHNNINVDAYS